VGRGVVVEGVVVVRGVVVRVVLALEGVQQFDPLDVVFCQERFFVCVN